jgi:Uma2 family endonuclease
MGLIKTPPGTIMEVFQMLPKGTLAEVLNGSLYISPAPSIKHQRITGKIFNILYEFVASKKLGEVIISPCDVFLDEHSNAVQPDVMFVSSAQMASIKEDAIHGVPDLLVEVLSPGNSEHDVVTKKRSMKGLVSVNIG